MRSKETYHPRIYHSHGDGRLNRRLFRSLGKKVIFERGVWVFHPENIVIGNNVYIGHGAFLKGYYKNLMTIGDNAWIGQCCFLHSGGGLRIGNNVGIGPFAKFLTQQHVEEGLDKPLVFCRQEYREVVVEDDCDIGIGSIILPGVTIGRGAIVGASSVVTRDVAPYTVVAGVPARFLRRRRPSSKAGGIR